MQHVILVFLIILYCSSCEKESTAENSFGTCTSNGVIEDSLSTSKLLIGSWKWSKSACGFCSDPGIYKADKLVIVEFRADNTFSLSQDSEIINQGEWSVEKADPQGFYISLGPTKPSYLDGSISICATELMSDARAWDGGAYLFNRLE